MDIFFMSFREANAEQNWLRTIELHPRAIRLHGVQGIDNIHMLCNKIAKTKFFWTIDGDNWLTEKLDFDYSTIFADLVMFKAIDPLQDTTTLLGGLKLWRTNKFVNTDMSKGDFTLNATKDKQVLDKVFSETRYNCSPFDAWKTSFRHCVKCMTVIFRSRPNAKNLDHYIEQWKSCKDINKLNANWAYNGYLDAKEYSEQYGTDLNELNKINDYDWLEQHFGNKYAGTY
jgi:hypothetical protein